MNVATRPVPDVPKVHLAQEGGYRFVVRFGAGEVPGLVTDEPLPLGCGAGPTPVMLLAAAVGNCLASSLKFCMSKAKLELEDLTVDVETKLGRDEHGRLRVDHINVRMVPWVTSDVQRQIGRCLEVFDSYCTVTASVRRGIRISVDVVPRTVAAEPNTLGSRLRSTAGHECQSFSLCGQPRTP